MNNLKTLLDKTGVEALSASSEQKSELISTVTQIGGLVVEEAINIFTVCGWRDDFCLRAIDYGSVVFGELNRVIWSARTGFVLDKSYCTKEFIEVFEQVYKQIY